MLRMRKTNACSRRKTKADRRNVVTAFAATTILSCVGAYLSVHEGPQRISKLGTTPLRPGMILSNEPGYYRAGEYGIRLENLVIVERREIAGAEREMYGFETITLAPFDLDCVEPRLMSAEETAWLNAYHALVRKTLSPLVDARTRKWLREATRAI